MRWTYGHEVEQFSFYDSQHSELRNRVMPAPYRFHRDGSGPGEFVLPPEDQPHLLSKKFLSLFDGLNYPTWEAERRSSGCGSHIHLMPDWGNLPTDQQYEVISFTWNTTVTLVALTFPFFSVRPTYFRSSVARWAAPTVYRLDRDIIEEYSPSAQNVRGRHMGRYYRSVTFNSNRRKITTIELRLNEQIPSWTGRLLESYDKVFRTIWDNNGKSPRLKNHYNTITAIYKTLPNIDLSLGPIEFDTDTDGTERNIPGMQMHYDRLYDFFLDFCKVYKGQRSKGGNALEFMSKGYHPNQLSQDLLYKPTTVRRMIESINRQPILTEKFENKPVNPIRPIEVDIQPIEVQQNRANGRKIARKERIIR